MRASGWMWIVPAIGCFLGASVALAGSASSDSKQKPAVEKLPGDDLEREGNRNPAGKEALRQDALKKLEAARQSALREYDWNRNGVLDANEKLAYRKARQEQHARAEARALRNFDADHDGVLNAEEQAARAEARTTWLKSMRAEILAHNDANRNGKLDADEKAAIRDRLTLGRLKALEMYDQNRDGRLDGAERKAAATGAIVAPDANKPGSVDTQAKDAGSPTLSNVMVTGAGTGDADIGFALGRETQVTIRVYDAAGRVVHTVASNQLMSAGSHAIRWDGRASGGRVANGMYLIRVDAFGQKVTKKFAMVK